MNFQGWQSPNMLLEKSRERRNEEFEPKQSQSPFVDVSGGESKVQCYKEKYCIGTWKVGPGIKVNWKWSNKRWQE